MTPLSQTLFGRSLTILAGFISVTAYTTSSRSAPTADLSRIVSLDEADSTARATLERIKDYVQNGQSDEAVESLRQVMEQYGEKIIRVSDDRCLSIREYCQVQLASLAARSPDTLKLYRGRVDSVAKKLVEEGLLRRDEKLLRNAVNQYFASSWGDDALFALGEMALEKGDFAAARHCWEQLDPTWRGTDGRPLWLSLREGASQVIAAKSEGIGLISTDLVYPDTDLNLADVRARLVLASILEGHSERARIELSHFQKLHPQATGRLAGKDALYAETLATLLADAQKWPPSASRSDWNTFAGDFARNHVPPQPLTIGVPSWPSITLGEPLSADISVATQFTLPQVRPAEDMHELLSYHPVIAGDLLVYCNEQHVFAFNLRTGQPAWPGATGKPGQIDNNNGEESVSRSSRNVVGVPRFTVTVHDHRVFARMGSPITIGTLETPPRAGNKIVILDLAQQGNLLREIVAGEKWAFEGAPVVDGRNLYVSMRYSDVRPQCFVACYEVDSGKLRWRRMICAAETLTQGGLEEATHNLLTLEHDSLYLNTNSGAVAALNKDDGHVQWITLYPRAKRGDPSKNAAHYFRDLNPCVYDRGSLFVAPSDCESILALDAATGTIQWESHASLGEAMHLLGVSGDHLIASGKKLWWLSAASGSVVKNFPESNAPPSGYGRGLLAGENVYWPTRASIEVFSAKTGERQKPVPLDVPSLKLTGGNLVAAHGYLLIATGTQLHCLGPAPVRAATAPPELTLRPEKTNEK